MNQDQIERVRRMCFELADVSEKVSHGEPTFFVKKRVFVMFANNHHNDGHVAVWVPVPPGQQADICSSDARTYFIPPYVGKSGWIGIELRQISDETLTYHIATAWELVVGRARLKP